MAGLINAAAFLNPVLLVAPISASSAQTSAAIDLQGYEGLIAITQYATVGGAGSLAGKITGCDTSGGTYQDVTGATFTNIAIGAAGLQTIVLDVKGIATSAVTNCRFIKYVGTAATGAIVFCAVMHGIKKYF